jgi:hypothetical protein
VSDRAPPSFGVNSSERGRTRSKSTDRDPADAGLSSLSRSGFLLLRVLACRFRARRWAGAGFEMTTLWVETGAGYLTEGLQVSEDPASSEDWSRAHLFRERLALREHLSPMARLCLRGCVCPGLRTSSRA